MTMSKKSIYKGPSIRRGQRNKIRFMKPCGLFVFNLYLLADRAFRCWGFKNHSIFEEYKIKLESYFKTRYAVRIVSDKFAQI